MERWFEANSTGSPALRASFTRQASSERPWKVVWFAHAWSHQTKIEMGLARTRLRRTDTKASSAHTKSRRILATRPAVRSAMQGNASSRTLDFSGKRDKWLTRRGERGISSA
jgi:hypothetical protein